MNKIKMDSIQELPYAVEESINRLRINVSFLGNEIKKIMVVSTLPNEGKSFVTMQMWKQMANAVFLIKNYKIAFLKFLIYYLFSFTYIICYCDKYKTGNYYNCPIY